ncbi:uncharacterized protein [Leptinotarsa decemlineata]|uniref:uncharacterized protein n=1 Tax=Leptinotarsa decemlineata TaxID=7539 RepID=UPI003D3043A8
MLVSSMLFSMLIGILVSSMLCTCLHLLDISMLVLSMLLKEHAQSKHSGTHDILYVLTVSSNKTMDNQTAIRMELNRIILLVTLQCVQKLLSDRKKKTRNRKIWVRDWLSRREKLGASTRLLVEMREEDINGYKNHLRMLPHQFDWLLSKIESAIKKQDTHMRNAIPPKVKLEVTLRYLATGDSLYTLEALHRVARSTIALFLPEVCDAIYNALKDYMRIPGHGDWKRIEHGFRTKWNFPGCVGAMDGKHINILAPDDTSDYYNYKGAHSIILLALVDDDYCFSYVNVGTNGRAVTVP